MIPEQLKIIQFEIERDRSTADYHAGTVVGNAYKLRAEALEALLAEREELLKDKARLDAIKRECWDLRCFSVPTGGGDADVAWEVIEHHMAEPRERVIGRGWSPEIAIGAAMKGEKMTTDKLKAAISEAERFLKRAKAIKTTPENRHIYSSKESGAVRRASMDLTRALADLRRNHWQEDQ